MKTYTTILTVFLAGLTTMLCGQTYHPFPTNGTWIYQRISDFGQPTMQFDEYRLLGDTSIGNHNYKKITLNTAYYAALRDSSQRIYFRSPDDTVEHILYDFNLVVGDTIINPYPLQPIGNYCDTVVVVSEDSFITSDGFRRRLNLYGCAPADWIEGIGGVMLPTYLHSVSGGYRLTCFYDSTQQVYSLFNGNCYSFVGIDETNPLLQFSVYPNPTANLLTLTNLPSISSTTSVTDLLGRQLLFYDNTPTNIDIAVLPDGIYFLTVQTNVERRTLRIEKFDSR